MKPEWTKAIIANNDPDYPDSDPDIQEELRKKWSRFINQYVYFCTYYGFENVGLYWIPYRKLIYAIAAPNQSFDRYDIDPKHLDEWEIEQAEKWTIEDLFKHGFTGPINFS